MGEFLRRQSSRRLSAVHSIIVLSPSGGPPRHPPAPRTISVARRNRYLLHDLLRLRPREIDRQQAIRKFRAKHLHAFREQKAALKLPRGDAAMDIVARLVFLLPCPGSAAGFPPASLRSGRAKTGDRKRDAQHLRRVARRGDSLDIIGRIAVRRRSSTLCRAPARSRRSRAGTENSMPTRAPYSKPLSGASRVQGLHYERPERRSLLVRLPRTNSGHADSSQ